MHVKENVPSSVSNIFFSLGSQGLVCLLVLTLSLSIFELIPGILNRPSATSFLLFSTGFSEPYRPHVYLFTLFAFLTVIYLAESVFSRCIQTLATTWASAHTALALATACTFLWLFIMHFGNRQFGGWDYGILIDTGWRQIQGQRPYTDFITPNPPGFNLAAKYAFRLFGVNWNAQLYLTAFFACSSFLWMYWLLQQLVLKRVAAFFIAFAIETVTVLALCFWWYNNSTAIIATLFFLSSVLYVKEPLLKSVQISYCLSLAFLVLMKPNIAGLLGAGCILLGVISTSEKARFVLLTFGSLAIAMLIIALNGISVHDMIACYHAAAIERGGLSTFGLSELSWTQCWMILGRIVVLSIPILVLVYRRSQTAHQMGWRAAAFDMMFALTCLVALYGAATDGEFKDLECGILIAAGAITVFGMQPPPMFAKRLYIALIFTIVSTNLVSGALRLRVKGIGVFFVENDTSHHVDTSFFKDLYASRYMTEVVKETASAVSLDRDSIFLSGRLGFEYAVNRLSSPLGLPLYWQPGTSFARKDEDKFINEWQLHHFKTLIFLKDDYPFYSNKFRSIIQDGYERDDHFPHITVYHSRSLTAEAIHP
jgi:hypothetical protein